MQLLMCVFSSIAVISMKKRDLVDLLCIPAISGLICDCDTSWSCSIVFF